MHRRHKHDRDRSVSSLGSAFVNRPHGFEYVTAVPAHTCCLAFYYDPADRSAPRDVPVYATAAVVCTKDDVVVDKITTYAKDMDCDVFIDKAMAMTKKYDAILIALTEPLPLEFCQCGCQEPLFRTVRRKDVERIIAEQKTTN